MNYARRWNRRAASTKARRKAVKDQIRRGLMAERLEDRTLMAADLGSLLASHQSAYWNIDKPSDVNGDSVVAPSDALAVINMLNSVGSHQLPQNGAAEGETGSKMFVDVNNDGYVSAADALAVINDLNGEGAPAPKVAYTLQVLDSSGHLLTGTPTVQQGQDFYLEFTAQDLRPAGKDPITQKNLVRGVYSAFSDVLLSDKGLFTYAVGEIQTLTVTDPGGTGVGSFTLSNVGTGNKTTGSINYDVNDMATTATNIATAINTALGANAVTVTPNAADGTYDITFSRSDEINVDQPLMQASANADVVEKVKGTALATTGDQGTHLAAITYNTAPPVLYTNQQLGTDAADRIDELGAFSNASAIDRNVHEVLRIHMIANKLSDDPNLAPGTTVAPLTFTLKVDGTTGNPLTEPGTVAAPDGMIRPQDNTLVLGNNNAGETSDVAVDEITLTNVTLNVTSGPIHADSFTATAINEDSGADSIDLLSHTGLNQGATGTVIINSVQGLAANQGTVTLSGANAIFTPAANFNGTATFTYTAQLQGDTDTTHQVTATVTVPVTSVNDKPTITVPGAQSMQENTALVFSGASAISVADVDFSETGSTNAEQVDLTVAQGTLALGPTVPGTLTVSGNNSAHITLSGTLADINTALSGLAYTAVDAPSASTSLTIAANDNGNVGTVGGPQTANATVTINITAQNDPPVNLDNGTPIVNGTHIVAIPNQAFTFSGHNHTFTVADPDSSNLTVTVSLANASQGTLQTTGGTPGTTVTLTGSVSTINTALASLTYTPPSGSVLPAVMTISSNDGVAPAVTSTINIDLDPGVRPFPLDDSFQFNEGDTAVKSLDVLANDFKATGATTTITAVGTPMIGSTPTGSVAIHAGGTSLDYTPPTDTNFFTSSTPITFTYTIHDDVAGSTDRTATVSINFKNIPDNPVAVNDTGFGAAFDSAAATQTPLVVTAANGVLANDTDVDNNYGVSNYAALTAVIVTQPTEGTVTLNPDGSFSYTPTGNSVPNDTFTYKVHAVTPEGAVDSLTNATVTIHVTTPPTATNDHFNVLEQGNPATSGNVLTGAGSNPASSADVDSSDGQSLTAVLVSNIPANLNAGSVTLNADGSFTYNPEPNQNFNTTRPPASDLTFTYQAKTSDGRLSHVATVSLTVQEVNDPPTAANDTFLGVKQNAAGTIGVDQPVPVLLNDSILPDVAISGDEHLTVTGVGLTATGPFSAGPVATAGGGSVKVVNGQVLYTSPTTIPVGEHDTFFYQISDNASAARGGALLASASVDVHVVDFVPKTISGTVYVDSNGDGQVSSGEKALSGVTVHLTGTAFDNSPVSLTATTDANGSYTFPAAGSNTTIKPPLVGTTYTITEDQPLFLLNGLDTNNSTNIDTTLSTPGNPVPVVTNPNRFDNAFSMFWSVTDSSGNITGLNFGEGGIDVRTPAQGGSLADSSGMKQEYLASSGQNGFIFELNADGTMLWSYKLDPSGTAWAGSSSISAKLSTDLSLLTFTVGTQSVTLTQNYSISGSTARFRILGVGAGGQWIIRVDGSANGATDGMGLALAIPGGGGEGEAAPVNAQYAGAADAVFAEKSWA